ncbi:hypothetical protein DFH94DRAFT_759141 [Russula ochroleuca]|uniref:Uncharacterized protein n=1 Tax=Russula ochroleuca TaxID=152965 RepID=A0A9P5MS02_9AGAM|nr:hypothetical protein DFH94DRAFT_759141 [Russula ochroleuca]
MAALIWPYTGLVNLSTAVSDPTVLSTLAAVTVMAVIRVICAIPLAIIRNGPPPLANLPLDCTNRAADIPEPENWAWTETRSYPRERIHPTTTSRRWHQQGGQDHHRLSLQSPLCLPWPRSQLPGSVGETFPGFTTLSVFSHSFQTRICQHTYSLAAHIPIPLRAGN